MATRTLRGNLRHDRVGAAPDVFGRAVDDGNPTPADGLQMFVTGLAAEGVSREQIQTMGCQIPGALLMG